MLRTEQRHDPVSGASYPWLASSTAMVNSAAFAALRLTPWRLRVMPATAMLTGAGEVLAWQT